MLSDAPVRLCCGQRHFGALCPDGKVMCCLCFERFPVEQLSEIDGVKQDVCIRCDELEDQAIYACIIDESAGLAECHSPNEEERMSVLKEAADKLTEISNKLAGIDLSDEKEKAVEVVQSAAAALGEVEATIRGFAEQFGDHDSMPSPVSVENDPADETDEEPAEGAE